MKIYAYLITIYSLVVSAILLDTIIMDPGDKSPEECYYLYLQKAEWHAKEAVRYENIGYRGCLSGQGDIDFQIRAQKLAESLAEVYRDRHNRQLSRRLWRALAITGDPKMYQELYNEQKL